VFLSGRETLRFSGRQPGDFARRRGAHREQTGIFTPVVDGNAVVTRGFASAATTPQ